MTIQSVEGPIELPSGFLRTNDPLLQVKNSGCWRDEHLIQTLFSGENPYWKSVDSWLGWVEGEARLALLAPKEQKTGEAYFGFWNAPKHSFEENFKLFKNAMSWLKEKGFKKLVGPINLKTAYSFRLQVSDFDSEVFPGEPRNPEFYPKFLEKIGFNPSVSYVTHIAEDLEYIFSNAEKLLFKINYEERLKLQIVPLDFQTWKRNKQKVVDVVNSIFFQSFGFEPLSQFDIDLLYKDSVIGNSCQRTSFLILNESSEVVGFCLTFPDESKPGRVLVKTLGINPSYRSAGKGFHVLMKYLLLGVKNAGYSEIGFCLMAEGNQAYRISAKYSNKERRYSLFSKDL